MLLSADKLRTRPALAHEDIYVPELGGKVRLRQWTGMDYDAFGEAVQAFKFDGSMYAAAVAVSVVTESGERVFDPKSDVPFIAETWAKVTLEDAYNRISKMNRLGQKALEDAEKN